jgi:phage tail sheath protein FI
MTGMIHGREARMAADWDGHHKAQAGQDAILPDVLELPTGDAVLNEEYLNPLGINVVKKLKGNFVLWGDRTLWLTTEWKWKHQRELMSYYEHVLQESFDFIIFAINDPETDAQALTSLQSFFLPEYVKRAIRGNTFEDAAILKVDSENNTDATRATGDLYADVSLMLADTVERFNIRIGKQGIFESVG